MFKLLKPKPPKRGRPPLTGAPMRRVNVMLDERTIEGLTALGGGNLSGGIRAAWQRILKYRRPS
jgi:hypothetical protein